MQKLLALRCRDIANLYIAYTNSGKFPDEFGREFYHAVGDILNGVPINRLELHHITGPIDDVVGERRLACEQKRKGSRSEKR